MNDREKILAALFVTLGLALGAVIGVSGTLKTLKAAEKEEAAETTTIPPVNVEVEVVRLERTLKDTIKLPAVVEPNQIVQVAAEIKGRIELINCKEGDLCVPPGSDEGDKAEPLIKLGTDLLEAELERAEATAELAKANYERMVELDKQGGTTKQDLDKAFSAFRIGKAAQKRAALELERAKIYTPIRGVVNELHFEETEVVDPGETIATTVDIDTVKVVTQVPEVDVQFLKTGASATVHMGVRGKPHTFVGKITYISALADERTRATRVEITLDNKKRLLQSGRMGCVQLVRRTLKDVIMIPLEAVIPLEHEKAVYVVETVEKKDPETGELVKKDVARRVPVTLDARLIKGIDAIEKDGEETRPVRRQMIRIKNGALKPGDRLIITSQQYVAHGQPVNETVLQFTKPAGAPPKK